MGKPPEAADREEGQSPATSVNLLLVSSLLPVLTMNLINHLRSLALKMWLLLLSSQSSGQFSPHLPIPKATLDP